jgi:acyl-CoA dehydrogenase
MSQIRDDISKSIHRLDEDWCSTSVREQAEAGVWPAELWEALESMGLTKAALPEEAGGVGLDFGDVMYTLRRCSAYAFPVPLAETFLAGRILAAAGLSVPDGPLTIAPAVPGEKLQISRKADAYILNGVANRIPWGNVCEHALVIGEHDGCDVVGLVSLKEQVPAVSRNLAGEPRARIEFNNTSLIAAAALPGAGMRLQFEGALARSVHMVGALEKSMDLTVQYANDRIQFGRPIGKFQAVQHMMAVMAGHVAAANAATELAIGAVDSYPSEIEVCIAKSRVGEAAGKGAEIAHQIHGAMGITREHVLHYRTRRLWAWRDEFGNEVYWQTRLGHLVATKGADELWPTLTRMCG